MIKIYTIPECDICVEVKEYFNSKDVEYTEIDMSKGGDKETIERKKQFKSIGIKTYPIIIFDENGSGEMIIPGLDKDILDSLLEKND